MHVASCYCILCKLSATVTVLPPRYQHFSAFIFHCSNFHDRSFLDSCLSHALNVPVKNLASLIDEHKYVMTLDYAMKMLSVHERRMCGVPVIIKGETGVGKTFLLEMLSHLWNESILTAISLERSSFQERLEQSLQGNDTEETREVLNVLRNKGQLDMKLLSTVLRLQDQQDPSKSLISDTLSNKLLAKRRNTMLSLSLVTFPGDTGSVVSLFEQASKQGNIPEVS